MGSDRAHAIKHASEDDFYKNGINTNCLFMARIDKNAARALRQEDMKYWNVSRNSRLWHAAILLTVSGGALSAIVYFESSKLLPRDFISALTVSLLATLVAVLSQLKYWWRVATKSLSDADFIRLRKWEFWDVRYKIEIQLIALVCSAVMAAFFGILVFLLSLSLWCLIVGSFMIGILSIGKVLE